jgi:hypothetical protein
MWKVTEAQFRTAMIRSESIGSRGRWILHNEEEVDVFWVGPARIMISQLYMYFLTSTTI